MPRRERREDLSDKLERTMRATKALQRSRGFPVVDSAPTDAAPEGAVRLQANANKLWIRSSGAWRSVTLT